MTTVAWQACVTYVLESIELHKSHNMSTCNIHLMAPKPENSEPHMHKTTLLEQTFTQKMIPVNGNIFGEDS